MAVIATVPEVATESTAIPLPLFARMAQIPENQFWGLRSAPDFRDWACTAIWVKADRDRTAYYLAEAQMEIEDFVRFPLVPTWVTGQTAFAQPDRFVDQQPFLPVVLAKWCRVITAGVRATSTILAGAVVTLKTGPAINDPAPIAGLPAVTFTDPNEVRVYHPGTDVEIHPSAVTIAGGVLTVSIPRCRLIKRSLIDNPGDGLDYNDDANFTTTVDVKRVYTDPATNALLVRAHNCSDWCASSFCLEYTEPACMLVHDPLIGAIRLAPGSYADGAWSSRSSVYCGVPRSVRLNYLAGLASPDTQLQAKDAVLRLAFAKMPMEECFCPYSQFMWARDHNIPNIMTRERINCRFGMSDGAWAAWEFATSMRITRSSVFHR